MNRILTYTGFILLILSADLFSQPLRNYSTGFHTIFDKSEKTNPYYFSANPAFLNYEISEQLLSIKSSYNNESGDFRRFIDPGNIRDYLLTASGKKEIDSLQIFKGSFSFNRKENNNWQWVFSRDYSNSPFIIGDSTTGDTRLNGILMSAEYCNTLFNLIGVGLQIDYEVDQGLKQVSPRPTSKNREFNITGGLNYKFMDNTSVGIKASVYDDVETINYREDVGALTTETVIIKFRGYDYPNVFRKKTETRYSYNNGYSGGLDLFYSSSVFNLDISGAAGFNKINIKDDAVNPVSDGFYKSDFYKGGILLNSSLSKEIILGLNYLINLNNTWAENLDYKVLYNKNKNLEHNITAGFEYLINEKISAGIEAGYEYSILDINDYYSKIKSSVKGSAYTFALGIKSGWSERISTFLSASFISRDFTDNAVHTTAIQSDYYSKFRYRDILFYQTPGSRYNFNIITSLLPGFGGELLLNIFYSINSSRGSFFFSCMKREETNFSIEYRFKAF